MPQHQREQILLVAALVAWTVLLLVLLLSSEVPHPWVDVSDKAAHAVGFAGLALPAWALTLERRDRRFWWLTAGAALVAFGAVVEVLQGVFTNTRKAQALDLVADTVGVGIGAACVGLVVRLVPKRAGLVLAALALASVTVLSAVVVLAPGPKPDLEACDDLGIDEMTRPAEPLVSLDFGGGRTDLIDLSERGVEATPDGLVFDGTGLADAGPAVEFSCLAARRNELTVATVFTPTNTEQEGPTRVVSISDGTELSDANVHIGVEKDGIAIRLRHGDRLLSEVIEHQLTAGHESAVVLRVSTSGEVDVIVDGVVVRQTEVAPDFTLWDVSRPLLVGNEPTGDRGFVGTIRSVDLYARSLEDDELPS